MKPDQLVVNLEMSGGGSTRPLLMLRKPGERTQTLDAEWIQTLQDTSEVVAGDSLAGLAGLADQLLDLGAGVYDSTTSFALAGHRGAGPSLVYLTPEFEPREIWRWLEPVAWETAASDGGHIVARQCGTVRAYGREEIPRVERREKQVRILVICCRPEDSPEAREIRLHVDEALDSLEAAWEDRLCPPLVRKILGPNTLDQIRRLAKSEAGWDCIHVIAHGDRKAGKILLEGASTGGSASGGAHWVSFNDFAQALTVFAPTGESGEVLAPRLISLNVCDSSPLALEIMEKMQGRTRLVGLLYKGLEDDMRLFFASLYAAVMEYRPPSDVHVDVFVEQAFLDAVNDLRKRGSNQWFLPVLYAPGILSPVFAIADDPEHEFRRVLDGAMHNWDDPKKVDQAMERLQEMQADPHEHVAETARRLHQHCAELRDLSAHLADLQDAIRPGSDWTALLDTWASRPLVRRVAGVATVTIDDEALSAVAVIRGEVRELRDMMQAGIDALGSLAQVQSGAAEPLRQGCEKLQKLFLDERKRTVPVEVLKQELDTLLSGEALTVVTARDLVHRLAQVRNLLEELGETGPTYLTDGELHRYRDQMDRQRQEVRDQLAGAQLGDTPPEELLQPGRRLDLCLWLKSALGDGAAPGAATQIPDDLDALSDFLDQKAGQLSDDRSKAIAEIRERSPAVLINEEAPLLLGAEVSPATNPYSCLHSFGIRYSSPMREVVNRSLEVEEPDGRRADVLNRAFSLLKDSQRRLCQDVLVLPCRDVEATTAAFQEAAEARLSGREPLARTWGDLDAMDRASILAAVGMSGEAAAQSWDAVVRTPEDWEVVRNAFLIHCHHAEILDPQKEDFRTAAHKLFALYGLLVREPSQVEDWVRSRFAIYPETIPGDVGDLATAVTRPLEDLVEATLRRAPDRETARQLRLEWHAELNGAGISGQHPRLPGIGGYWAVHLQGKLPEQGRFLMSIMQHMAQMSSEALVDYFRAVHMTQYDIERLIILFSEHRLADAASANDSMTLLRPSLPANLELAGGEITPAMERITGEEDFADRFPMHAALPPEDQARMLAATAAVVLKRKTLEELRERLRAETGPKRKEIIRLLSDLRGVSTYLHDVGYSLASLHERALEDATGVFSGWVQQLADTFESDAETDFPPLERALGMADFLLRTFEGWGVPTRELSNVFAQTHCTVAVYLANESHDNENSLKHMKSARALDRNSARILLNYLRACDMEVRRLSMADRLNDAKRLAQEALAEARRSPTLLQGEEIEHELESIEGQRDELDGPSPRLPGLLREVRLLDEDD